MKLRLLMALNLAVIAVHAMEQTALVDTPLHQAAKTGDYPKCLALLTEPTWMTESLIQKAQFPEDAITTIQTKGNKDAKGFEGQPQEFMEAMKKMSQFAFVTHKFLNHQIALAKVQQTALNDQLSTPYECAAQAKASQELLALLNPEDNNLTGLIMPFILQKLGATGKMGMGMPRQNSAGPVDPRGPVFNQGDKITLLEREFKVTQVGKFDHTSK